MSKSAKTPSRRKLSPQPSTVDQDPVEVFCRVRPLQEDEEDSCVEVLSDSVLQVTPPESSLSFKSGHSSVVSHTSMLDKYTTPIYCSFSSTEDPTHLQTRLRGFHQPEGGI